VLFSYLRDATNEDARSQGFGFARFFSSLLRAVGWRLGCWSWTPKFPALHSKQGPVQAPGQALFEALGSAKHLGSGHHLGDIHELDALTAAVADSQEWD